MEGEGEGDGEEEQDESGQGIGVNEGASNAAFGEFGEDDGVGDVEAVGVDDDAFLFHFEKGGGGEVGPAGVFAFEDDLVM